MKKITMFNLINILLTISYFVFVFVKYQFSVLPMIQLNDLWFPLLCAFVSLSMFVKSALFRSDSALWLAVCLIILSAVIIAQVVSEVSVNQWWPTAFVILSLACLTVGLVFREMYQIKMFVVLNIVSVPCFLFSFDIIEVWMFIVIEILVVCLCIVVYYFVPNRWYSKKTNSQKHRN